MFDLTHRDAFIRHLFLSLFTQNLRQMITKNPSKYYPISGGQFHPVSTCQLHPVRGGHFKPVNYGQLQPDYALLAKYTPLPISERSPQRVECKISASIKGYERIKIVINSPTVLSSTDRKMSIALDEIQLF